jgi:hypothetical protein
MVQVESSIRLIISLMGNFKMGNFMDLQNNNFLQELSNILIIQMVK